MNSAMESQSELSHTPIYSGVVAIDKGLLLPLQPSAQTWEDFLEAGVRLANADLLDDKGTEQLNLRELRIQATEVARTRWVESGKLPASVPVRAWTLGALRTAIQHAHISIPKNERYGMARVFRASVIKKLGENALLAQSTPEDKAKNESV